MSRSTHPVTRKFPDYGWAWPSGPLHQLLEAALLPDDDVARAKALEWLDRYDIETAAFGDHRLLATICDRFGKGIAHHAAYPRLLGLRRQLWTRSQMGMRETAPTLVAMSDADIPLLLIKGAARIAVNRSAAKRRVAHDIDIVVGDEHVVEAFAVIERCGWQSSSGFTHQYLKTQLPTMQSMNFFRGSFGDIDLHRDAYPSIRDDADEKRLWRDAQLADYLDVAVRVPSPADNAALALAHGALAAHVHSDWIVDFVEAIHADGFSWQEFARIVDRRKIGVAATILLSYLSQELAIEMPPNSIRQLAEAADGAGTLDRLRALLQAKPRSEMSAPLHAARWFAKKTRIRKERASRGAAVAMPIIRGRRVVRRPSSGLPSSTMEHVLRQPIEVPADASVGKTVGVSILLEVSPPAASRRIEFEINGQEQHIARLRYRNLGQKRKPLLIRFEGQASIDEIGAPMTLEARPIRQLRDWEGEEGRARYGALPFKLLKLDIGNAGT